MDINLLNETKKDEPPRPPQRSELSEPKLTKPAPLEPPEPEPKLPSRFSLWLKSLRGKPKPDQPAPPAPPPLEPKLVIPRAASPRKLTSPAPEDIFAQIDAPNVDPGSVPPIHMPAEPVRTSPPAPRPMGAPKKNIPPPLMPTREMPPRPPAGKNKPETPGGDRSSLVNLIPSEFRQSIDPRSKLIRLGLTVLGCLVVLGGTYALLTLYRTSILEKIQTLRAEGAAVEQQINDMRPRQREAIATRTRLTLISDLLDQHIYWTKFFSKLEAYTIDDVYYTGAFTGSLGGQVTLTAVGSAFTAPARQLLALQQAQDFVSGVSITSATATETTTAELPPGSLPTTQVTFAVTLTLIPDIFTYTAADFPASRVPTETVPIGTPSSMNPFGLTPVTNTSGAVGNTNTNASGSAGNTNTSSPFVNSNSSTNRFVNASNVNTGL